MNPLVKFYDEIETALKLVNSVDQLLDGYAVNKNISNFAVNEWMKTNTRKDPNFCAYYDPKVLRQICEKPGTLKSTIIEPLKSWLNEYKNSIKYDKNNKQTGKEIDSLAKRGIRAIYNFTVITHFFATNPNYLVPGGKKENLDMTKKFMLELLEEMDNCTSKLNKIYERMNSLVISDVELTNMKSYIKQMCLTIRIERLKM